MRSFTKKPKATQQTMSARSAKPGRPHLEQSRERSSIPHSQCSIGNPVVQRLLQAHAEEFEPASPTCASTRFTHDFSRTPLHTDARANLQQKLKVNTPHDIYEQEADRVAEQVMQRESQVQRQPEEGEELQMKAGQAPLQRREVEEEEPLQGKFDPVQRQSPGEEEEPLQGKFDPVQRQSPGEEELLQGKFTSSETPTQPRRDKGSADSHTGMPAELKSGLEALSGINLSRVHVHKNSSRPARLNALAYAQGKDIHLGPRQEKNLPHEGWHVVQQMQGRVNATRQLQGVSINDDDKLEREADVMGARALQTKPTQPAAGASDPKARPDRRSLPQVLSLKTRGKCKTKFDKAKYLKVTTKEGDTSMTAVVDRLIKAKTITVKGRRDVYVKKMNRLNYRDKAYMRDGDCLLMLKTWDDPNIGQLPPLKELDPKKSKSDLMAKIIATIYAEQTQDLPDQHKYIWYAIRKRIESWERPAKLVYPGAKKGVLSQFHAFGNAQYMLAKNYIKSGKKTNLPKKKFNPDVVDKIKTMVESEWTTKIPTKAGMFYFHWTKNKSPTLNNCWKKKENKKKNDADRESTCVEEFRKKLKWKATLSKTIPAKKAPKKGSPPIGSMYIFKSYRKP